MRILEYLRRYGFWTLDFIKGSRISNHYKDIASLLEDFDSDFSKETRKKYLDNILNHAIETVPYYTKLNVNSTFLDFPILNKLDLRNHFKELQSSKGFKNKYTVNSSGSTGITSTTTQDQNKKNRNTADILYFKHKAGFEVGERIYYIRRWFEVHKKSNISTWLQNIKKVEVSKFDDAYLKALLERLQKDPSHKMILSYSSALRDLANYLEKTNHTPINSNISCIIAMSESIGENTVALLKKYFNTDLFSRYSNLENGLFGLQLPNQGEIYHLNWASYYFEILDLKEDKPVKDEELGRVVITDLFNYAMPIIRYDTGDLAYFSHNNYFNKAKGLSKVEGRKMDLIRDTNGNPVSSFIIFHLESYPEIQQFQLIQNENKDYVLKLVIQGDFNKNDELIDLYKGYLGNDANIKVEIVKDILRLPSGKRRLTVNNKNKI